MKTITLSGFIKKEYVDSFETIKLIQQDGYKIDLVNRFKEAVESYNNLKVQVNYYLSDNICTKNEMLEGWLSKISGSIVAEYEKNDHQYSFWTSETNYDTNFSIGGHDMLSELQKENGRYIIIELNFND